LHTDRAASLAHPNVRSRSARLESMKTLANYVAPPFSDSYCRSQWATACYSPQEVQNAYGLSAMLNAGYTGAGQTIIIIDSFGSPTISQDLAAFDAGFGLPDPPSFTVLAPLGTVPFDP